MLVTLWTLTACTVPPGDSAADEENPQSRGYVLIPASTFTMGCTPGQADCDDDETVHEVTLTHDYWLGVTEVTQAEFHAVMGYNRSIFDECEARCPVEHLSWYEQLAYVNALSDEAGFEQCYSCDELQEAVTCTISVSPYACEGFRLPTEAEWEGAARCGEDFEYAGSDTLSEVGWVEDNSDDTTHEVANLAPNACGLYDMSGNVFERTQDVYGPLPADDVTDPVGDEDAHEDALIVGRGGSWSHTAQEARTSDRSNGTTIHLTLNVGFRVARTAQ